MSRFFIGTALLLSFASPARAQARQLDEAKPFAELNASAESIRDSLVALARAQVGTKYVRGGSNPERGFDCSGFVKYVMNALNVALPRSARQQAREGVAVNRDTTHLRPGDLLTFGKTQKSSVTHIGIYIGDGKYVHASSVAGQVIESKLDRKPTALVRAWQGARRILQIGQAPDKKVAKVD
jgi:cell wall-associated NlpC family hydrolase